MWYTLFEVTGPGAFPADMLRYDCCFPNSGEDVDKLDTPILDPNRCRCGHTRDQHYLATGQCLIHPGTQPRKCACTEFQPQIGTRTVRLVTTHSTKSCERAITDARWRSFGWVPKVVETKRSNR